MKTFGCGGDLNHRPLGYEFCEKRNFNELAGVVVRTKEWKRALKSDRELLFWVGFGLAAAHASQLLAP